MKEGSKGKLEIELIDWTSDCGDGCCTNYGTTTKVNGEEMPLHNQDVGTILEMVLKHLGYDVEVKEVYEYE